MKHTKMLLPGGLVLGLLVVLGWMATTAQAGNPAPSLQAQATEPSPRYGHTMVTISNTVYLFGGEAQAISGIQTLRSQAPQGVLFNDLSKFDDNGWTEELPVNAPPPARKNHSAAVYNGKMYVFFGEGASGMLNDIWEYDPAAKTWTQMPSNGAYKPVASSHHTVVVINGEFLFYGGVNASGIPVNAYVYAYDPLSGYWTRKEMHPEGARYGHTAANVNNRLVVYGGTDGSTFFDDLWQYNPTTDQWTDLNPSGSKPPARAFHTFASDGTKIWLAGGKSSTTDLADTWEYDITENKWTRKTDLPAPRSDHAAALLPSQGSSHALAASVRILIFGGQRDGQAIAETLIYTPSPQVQIYLPLILRSGG